MAKTGCKLKFYYEQYDTSGRTSEQGELTPKQFYAAIAAGRQEFKSVPDVKEFKRQACNRGFYERSIGHGTWIAARRTDKKR
jgi:hypothetical protein